MTPSIGRIVHYRAGDIVSAAIITRVWADDCVNLMIFRDGGPPDIRGQVMFDGGEVATLPASWKWPDIVSVKMGGPK